MSPSNDKSELIEALEMVLENKRLRAELATRPTYTLIADKGSAIKCFKCGMISHNMHDVYNLYCGNCKEFHDKNAGTR